MCKTAVRRVFRNNHLTYSNRFAHVQALYTIDGRQESNFTMTGATRTYYIQVSIVHL